MSSDPIGDMLAMLWNANHKFRERVDLPASRLRQEVARVLKEEGYITDYKVLPDRKQGTLRVTMRYTPEKARVIQGVKRVSKPGLRKYSGYSELPKVLGGLGISIVSTSKGVMSDKQSRRRKLGGEILARVW
ncbi:MAG: 30S ribosomal protein S8 [Elusimicrobiota bacterium]|jgi:small subunit ribosomal protein S8